MRKFIQAKISYLIDLRKFLLAKVCMPKVAYQELNDVVVYQEQNEVVVVVKDIDVLILLVSAYVYYSIKQNWSSNKILKNILKYPWVLNTKGGVAY